MLTTHSPLGSFFRRRGQDHFCQLEFFTMYLLSRSLHLFLRSSIVSQVRGFSDQRSVKRGERVRDEAAVVGERVAALKEAWHLNAVRESRVRRFLLGFLTRSAGGRTVGGVWLFWRPLRFF